MLKGSPAATLPITVRGGRGAEELAACTQRPSDTNARAGVSKKAKRLAGSYTPSPMSSSPAVPIVHAVAAESRRHQPLDPNVAIAALSMVLMWRGMVSFLLLFVAVLALEDRLDLRRLTCGVIGAILGVGDWLASCIPQLREHAAAQPPDGIVQIAHAIGEMVDQLLGHRT